MGLGREGEVGGGLAGWLGLVVRMVVGRRFAAGRYARRSCFVPLLEFVEEGVLLLPRHHLLDESPRYGGAAAAWDGSQRALGAGDDGVSEGLSAQSVATGEFVNSPPLTESILRAMRADVQRERSAGAGSVEFQHAQPSQLAEVSFRRGIWRGRQGQRQRGLGWRGGWRERQGVPTLAQRAAREEGVVVAEREGSSGLASKVRMISGQVGEIASQAGGAGGSRSYRFGPSHGVL